MATHMTLVESFLRLLSGQASHVSSRPSEIKKKLASKRKKRKNVNSINRKTEKLKNRKTGKLKKQK